jgi:hypothetical protein
MATTQTSSLFDAHSTDAVDIERIIHEIQNNLQVIRMEADLKGIEPKTQPRHECAFDAAQNIEELLELVRRYFSQSR